MDRLEQLRLERRAAESPEEVPTFRLFTASAWVVLGAAAIGIAIFSFELLPPPKAGAVLAVGLTGGLPFFGLGRRHARRN